MSESKTKTKTKDKPTSHGGFVGYSDSEPESCTQVLKRQMESRNPGKMICSTGYVYGKPHTYCYEENAIPPVCYTRDGDML